MWLHLDFLVVMFAFLFVDMFDTLGTLIGVASKANMLDAQGRLPRIRGALLSDSVGTAVGAVLGTSTTTTFVESASGVAEGRKNRFNRSGSSNPVRTVPVLVPDLPGHPVLCNGSGSGRGRLSDADLYPQGKLRGLHRGNPGLCGSDRNAVHVQHLRGYRNGNHLLCSDQSGNRKAKEKNITPLMYVLAVLFVLKYILL